MVEDFNAANTRAVNESYTNGMGDGAIGAIVYCVENKKVTLPDGTIVLCNIGQTI